MPCLWYRTDDLTGREQSRQGTKQAENIADREQRGQRTKQTDNREKERREESLRFNGGLDDEL